MAEENYQKIKLLKITEILRQETDEEHPMTKVELAARLVAMNISCSPRSLRRDKSTLTNSLQHIYPGRNVGNLKFARRKTRMLFSIIM